MASIILLILAAVWLISVQRQRNSALASKLRGKAALEIQHQKLKESEERLQKTNDLKNKILSVLGHDLRNPLNNISTLLSTATSANLSQSDLTEILNYLKKETDVSHIILKEILAWARLQMDEEGKYIEPIDAHELIEEIIAVHNHKAQEKLIAFNTTNGAVEFWADRNQMKSVFSNLVFNAIKFSKKAGQITVDISQNENEVIFKITDSGKGIDAMVLENLNKRNKIISEDGTGGERGTGIGLRIVNDFVEDHHGSLCFENNTEGGATVTVKIPLRQNKTS